VIAGQNRQLLRAYNGQRIILSIGSEDKYKLGLMNRRARDDWPSLTDFNVSKTKVGEAEY